MLVASIELDRLRRCQILTLTTSSMFTLGKNAVSLRKYSFPGRKYLFKSKTNWRAFEQFWHTFIFFSWNKLLRAMVESLSNLTSSWWMRWQIWVCCLTNPSMWWQICVWCVTNPSETHCVSLTSLSTHVQGGLVPQQANSSAPIVSPPPACTSCCTSCCWCRPTCTFPLVTCSPRCIEARNRVAQNFSGIALQRIQAKDQNIANTIRFFTFQLFFPFLSFNFNSIPLFNQLRTSYAKVLKVLYPFFGTFFMSMHFRPLCTFQPLFWQKQICSKCANWGEA